MMPELTHNQKVALFMALMVGAAVMLWGFKGLSQLLPGPSAK